MDEAIFAKIIEHLAGIANSLEIIADVITESAVDSQRDDLVSFGVADEEDS